MMLSAEKTRLRTSAPETEINAVSGGFKKDAKAMLRREHYRLVGRLAIGGAVLTLILSILLSVVANSMGRALGDPLCALVALAMTALFAGSFVPRYAHKLRQILASERFVDPMTGRPLSFLWWARWFSASLAVLLLLTLINSSPRSSANSSNSSSTDIAQTLMRCFCDELSSERKTDALKNSGVPTLVWPNIDDAIKCVSTSSNIDKGQAQEAWDKERSTGIFKNVDDGPKFCNDSGQAVYAGEAAPENPELMQRARELYCASVSEGPKIPVPNYDPSHPDESQKAIQTWAAAEGDVDDTNFANSLHISKERARAATQRASSEELAGLFVCEKAHAVAKSADDVFKRASKAARRTLCRAFYLAPNEVLGAGALSQSTVDAFKDEPDSQDWLASGEKSEEMLEWERDEIKYRQGDLASYCREVGVMP